MLLRSGRRAKTAVSRHNQRLPQTCSLPVEVVRRILQNPALSLADLAKLAPICKLFYEAYLERCAAEEKCLAESARAVFGSHVVDTLLRCLTHRRRKRRRSDPHAVQRYDLRQGDPMPSESTLTTLLAAQLNTHALGLMGPGQESNVTWFIGNYGDVFIGLMVEGVPMMHIQYGMCLKLLCITATCAVSQAMPFLGLAHLACKQVAAGAPRKTALRGWRMPMRKLCLHSTLNLKRKLPFRCSPWADARRAGPDGQRALATLHMWNRRFGKNIPNILLLWTKGASELQRWMLSLLD
eukprot:jgi/Botrbrau1/10832/Bobra.0025s0011.1